VAGGELVEHGGLERPAHLAARHREAISDRAPGFETGEPDLKSQPDRQLVVAVRLGLLCRPFHAAQVFVRRREPAVSRARRDSSPSPDKDHSDEDPEAEREDEGDNPTAGAEGHMDAVETRR
jgi:hypothetical protein